MSQGRVSRSSSTQQAAHILQYPPCLPTQSAGRLTLVFLRLCRVCLSHSAIRLALSLICLPPRLFVKFNFSLQSMMLI